MQPTMLVPTSYDSLEPIRRKKGGRRSGVVVGDFVFRKIMPAKSLDPKGKFRPNWEGPYAISAVYPGNAYLLPLDSLRDFARWVRFSLE